MDRAFRAAFIIVYGTAVAVASAWVALAGAPEFFPNRAPIRFLAGTLVALAMGMPYLLSAVEQLWRKKEERLQPQLQNIAERLREAIVEASMLSRNDVGVHVYVARRRRWPLWRHEMVRVARSAWHERTPDPKHRSFRQHWWTGKAPGVTGLAWESGHLEKENLSDPIIQSASEQQWNAWLKEDDRKARRIPYYEFRGHNNFSAVWAQPTNTDDGINGMMTVNVELEVEDGHQRLLDAGTERLLHRETHPTALAIG